MLNKENKYIACPAYKNAACENDRVPEKLVDAKRLSG
jgi:hypothetical protein